MKYSEFLKDLNEINVPVVAVTSILLLFIIKIIYALFVFIQFSIQDILILSAVIFLLLFLLSLPILKTLRFSFLGARGPLFFGHLISFIFLFFLLYSFNSQSVNYIKFFPLLEFESGLGWHRDTTYHVTLIHSIMNNGYPSAMLHGSAVNFYHVLSHYVDAAIFLSTGIDPLDGNGILYSFKEFLFLSCIVLLLASICGKNGYLFFFGSLLIFLPLAVGGWRSTFSYGLWFTGLVSISLIPFLLNLLSRKDYLKWPYFLIIFFLGVVLSLGKISSGFSFSLFMGFLLFIKFPRDRNVYLLGLSWFIFYFLYSNLFSQSYGQQAGVLDVINLWSVESIFLKTILMLNDRVFLNDMIFSLYVLLLLSLLIYFKNRSVSALQICFSGLLSFVVLAFMFSLRESLGNSDRFYFLFGLFFLLQFFVYSEFSRSYPSLFASPSIGVINNNWFFILIFAVSAVGVTRTTLNLFNFDLSHSYRNFISRPFDGISKIDGFDLAPKIYAANRLTLDLEKFPSRPLFFLRSEIDLLLKSNGLNRSNVLVFVPKEIYLKDFPRFAGRQWANGLLLTAVTGLPLAHGAMDIRAGYGFSDYDENALWRPRNELATGNACSFGKTIIVVEQLSPPKLSLHPCLQP
jgi:hypothetical protein